MIKEKFSKGLAILAMTTVILIAFSGCIEEEKETNTKDMIKMMPEKSEYLMIVNLKAIREEPNLKEFYDVMTRDPDALVLNYEDIDLVGVGASSSGNFSVTILKGKFDDTDIETATGGCEEVEYYKDVEIWTECEGNYGSMELRVVLSEELVMLCEAENQESVKKAIDTVEGREKSVYDIDEDVRDVVNRLLPNGITTTIMKESYHGVYHSVAMGFTAVKEDENTIKFKVVLKFKTKEDAAEHGKEVMEELDKEEMEISDLEMKQDGEFVEITGKLPVKNLSGFLGYSS